MTDLTLPILDLSQLDESPEAAARFRDDLRAATHDVGFFYLTGTGVTPELEARLHRTAREFFELDEADKLAIENLNSPQFRGYTRIGGERTQGKVDWREQIDIGPERDVIPDAVGYWRLQGPNLWPPALPALRPAFERWSAALSDVGLRLLRHWAVSLGAAEDVFDAAFADQPATLIKVVRYPGTADTGQGVGAHKDSGVLTLLLLEPGSRGLQVEITPGRWIDAPPVDGAFVVNTGELLEVATGGYLRANIHRVVSPPQDADRLSVAFFLSPQLDAELPLLPLPPALAAQAHGIDRDPQNPLISHTGRNLLKGRLRSHPDVALRHHADVLAAHGVHDFGRRQVAGGNLFRIQP